VGSSSLLASHPEIIKYDELRVHILLHEKYLIMLGDVRTPAAKQNLVVLAKQVLKGEKAECIESH